MEKHRTLFVWLGILCLSGMFLLGQESWAPPICIDLDGDGYGNPGGSTCTNPGTDCNDDDPNINPGQIEGPDGDASCGDLIDNDCSGAADMDDPACIPCTDDDGDGYGNPGTPNCTNAEEDCDDGNANVNPDAAEGPTGDATCSDSLDNDCDGDIDDDDSRCVACNDSDEDGYGAPASAHCTYPQEDCDDTNFNANPGEIEGPEGDDSCSDNVDNDCDGDIDVNDLDCETAMAAIPSGTFMMGDVSDGCTIGPVTPSDECPVHDVYIPGFWMDRHEVTNAEYKACVDGTATLPSTDPRKCQLPVYLSPGEGTPYADPAYSNHPVRSILYSDALAYCEFVGKRLPSEAEWEYAARGRVPVGRYPFQAALDPDTIDETKANYNSSDTTPVGSFPPNDYGLYDLAGNVEEWTSDKWWTIPAYENFYEYCLNNPSYDPRDGPLEGYGHGMRGGHHNSFTDDLRVASRKYGGGTWNGLGGFRCILRCLDNDGDGYGAQASENCPNLEADCDDDDSNVNPGIEEGPFGGAMCSDSIDNDCDNTTDNLDTGCYECFIDTECDDGNPCTDNTCVNGFCSYPNNTNTCDDNNACTTNDVCSGGTCTGGPPLVCDDTNGCTDDTCDPGTGCVFTNNTASCEDGNFCTTGDVCSAGTCVAGPPPDCDDANGCTDDTCDPGTGCVNTDNTASCDDGDLCTTMDTCAAGACVGGPPLDCDDANGCTDDTCDPGTGCVITNNTASCEDGDLCTTGDVCSGGICAAGPAVNCDDANDCTDDTCDPGTGCDNTNNTNACDDGDLCTTNDVCSGGSCVGEPVC